MILSADRERLRSLLTETMMLLCKTSLQYKTSFSVEGLIGITVDEVDIILINIRELVGCIGVPATSTRERVESSQQFSSKDNPLCFSQNFSDGRRLSKRGSLQQGSATVSESTYRNTSDLSDDEYVEVTDGITSQLRTTLEGLPQQQSHLQRDDTTRDDLIMVKEERPETTYNNNTNISNSISSSDVQTTDSVIRWTAPGQDISRTCNSRTRSHISPNQFIPSTTTLNLVDRSASCKEHSGRQRCSSNLAELSSGDDVVVKQEVTVTSFDDSLVAAQSSSIESYDLSEVNAVSPFYLSEQQRQVAGCSTFDNTGLVTLPYPRDRNLTMSSAQHYVAKRGKMKYHSSLHYKAMTPAYARRTMSTKDFSCPYCNRILNCARNLRGHMAAMHDEAKEFTCTICYRQFAYKNTLKQHIIALHKDCIS